MHRDRGLFLSLSWVRKLRLSVHDRVTLRRVLFDVRGSAGSVLPKPS